MLDQLFGWIKSVLVIGLAVSLLKTIVPAGTPGRVFSFVSALAIALTFLSPLASLNISFSPGGLLLSAADRMPTANEEKMSGAIIETGLAAYISKQAEELGLKADVTVRTENLDGGQRAVTGVDVAYRLLPSRAEAAALADRIEERYGIGRDKQCHRFGRLDMLK